MTDEERWPFGKPVNRETEAQAKLVPVPGRPHWWTDGKGGEPKYIEPPRKVP